MTKLIENTTINSLEYFAQGVLYRDEIFAHGFMLMDGLKTLYDYVFANCCFYNCSFNWVIVNCCTFNNCTFKYCSFLETKFSDSVFSSDCTFNECDFSSVGSVEFSFSSVHREDIVIFDKLIPMKCPREGEFIAYKKCTLADNMFGLLDSAHDFRTNYFAIVKLLIPADAKRSSACGNKCRCDKAKVLSITKYKLDPTMVGGYKTKEINKAYSIFQATSIFRSLEDMTVYTTGAMVYPDSYNENRFDACSHGIHFFMTEEEAINYKY